MLFLFSLLLYQQSWTFTDVTSQAGVVLDHDYVGTGDKYYIAAGAAAADIDGDGWLDLYVLGGRNQSNGLFRNRGDGTFQDITAAAGVALAHRFDCGVAFADVNGDDLPDLLVGGIDVPPVLFRNKGDGTFEDITETAGLSLTGSSFSAAFGDSDRDGDLDLFISHWQTGNGNFFFENDGDGRFSNATLKAGFSTHFLPDLSFTPNFVDLNDDRWPDLLIAADLGHSQVFLNDRKGAFVEVTDGVITDENGMGAAVGDYNNDGLMDWFVSSVGRANAAKRGVSGNRLYQGLGDGRFQDVTETAGVREGFWGWGAGFADFDNDGWLDLFHTNGFLGPFAPGYDADPSRFFHNNGNGTFTETAESLGLADPLQGRGVVCFDFDRDGDLDIFLATNGHPGRLLRNDGGNQGNYLFIDLVQAGNNRRAVGARISISTPGTTQIRELRAGNNFVSQDPTTAHFGLGRATEADITIQWPDGQLDHHASVPANQFLSYRRNVGPTYCTERGIRWISHLTDPDSDFETLLLAKNFSGWDVLVDLVAYDRDGRVIANRTLALAPGEQQTHQSSALFAGLNPSHLAVYAPPRVILSTGYQLAEGTTATAHTHEQSQEAGTFYVYPGNWDIVYDGMALLNTGETSIEVHAAMLDEAGNILTETILTPALAPRAKHLTAFNGLFQAGVGTMIRVTTTGSAQVLFLRGTHAGAEPGMLYQVKQIPVPAHR